jgi:hypothetical protein
MMTVSLNRFPLLTAVMLSMDCSGGPVFSDPMTIQTALEMFSGRFGFDQLVETEKDLEQYSGSELGLIGMGAWVNDEGPKPSEATEFVLNQLYEIA